ncbi:heme-degrading domain-containing protein [Paenibacillus frigoriresistens]|uniref:heme-degrading domain-containing protein n=1 Tax=Paenibacillus alginolyticus TaxID=59839 RepID=UPI001563565A|nr:heme-degrading domain-containing protein [Paenibacillus frigoriresistens]NRF95665.1 heme-degrading domain-containing protein [Paenibacillus frigoriresistens]
MMKDELLLEELMQEEEELQFAAFSNEIALQIGMAIIKKVHAEGNAVTIDICRGQQQIFHFACSGTSADNDDWTARKGRIVERFNRSSYFLEVELRASGRTITERYFLDPSQYAPYNGAFPIRVRGAGMIGTIAVSGLNGDQDHKLITSVLRDFLDVEH